MKIIKLIYFPNYISDLSLLIFCIAWRMARHTLMESTKLTPILTQVVPTLKELLRLLTQLFLFNYFLLEMRLGCVRNIFNTWKNCNYSGWNHIRRLGYRKGPKVTVDDERIVSNDVADQGNLSSFLGFLRENKMALFKKNFYQEMHKHTRMHVYKHMPLRMLSRLWGYLNSMTLPYYIRRPTYLLYVWMFNCNLEETIIQDLRRYRNLSEFFRRLLKPELRPIHQTAHLTSPVDGRILFCGRVKNNLLEQVKGVTYSLQEFLGPFDNSTYDKKERLRCEVNESLVNFEINCGDEDNGTNLESDTVREIDFQDSDSDCKKAINLNFSESEEINVYEEKCFKEIEDSSSNASLHPNRLPSKCYSMVNLQKHLHLKAISSHSSASLFEKEQSHLLENPFENSLFYCVLYLAPGDYHRFHSPTNWQVQYRRHFPGELFSVNPSVARWLKGLFNLNERVVYYGRWLHGFFSMTAVGATNVGSIGVYIDKKLKTNTRQKINQGRFFDKNLITENQNNRKKTTASRKESKLDATKKEGMFMKKGKLFGEFNLGSTIVLLFEAPKNLTFKIEPGHKVKYGEPLI